jgi:hypothetical protein
MYVGRRLARSQQKESANVKRHIDEERAEEAEEETLVVCIGRRFTGARPLGGLLCFVTGVWRARGDTHLRAPSYVPAGSLQFLP